MCIVKGMLYRGFLVLLMLIMLVIRIDAQDTPFYPICHSEACLDHHIPASIDESTGSPDIPLPSAGLNIIPEPPTTIDWTDLLNADGSSKGPIPIHPTSNITMSATLVGSANLITSNKFHHPAQSSSTITVSLSGSYNLKGNVFYIGTSEYVESNDVIWDNLNNSLVTSNNRLTGSPGGPQGAADYHLENVSSFQITIGNTGGSTLSQHITVPNIHLAHATTAPIYTNVWGSDGADQHGEGLIPEFSFAGFKSGYETFSPPSDTINILNFGAAGDGISDDTQSIKNAIASIDSGVIYFPAGTYLITDTISIKKSNIFLIGEDMNTTKFFIPLNLRDILEGVLSGSTNPSFGGGFISFIGVHSSNQLSSITQEADRGATRIYVADTSLFTEGQELRFYQNGRQLTSYMAGAEASANNWVFQQLIKITCIGPDYLDIDRPLRVPIILSDFSGYPRLYEFAPSVRGGGVSNFTIEFPNTIYNGHWTEEGYNAISLVNAVDVRINMVHIRNADSGIFAYPGNLHNELSDISFTSERSGIAGHHGIVAGNDMLIKNINFQVPYLHDLTVTRGSSGNVFKNCTGTDLNLDFHHGAPYETLFTDSDLGLGTRWLSSSGGGYGYHSGKRTVYWNLRSSERINGPPADQAPPGYLVMVGLNFGLNFGRLSHHTEYITPEDIRPQNMHEAQLIRRYADIFIKEGDITEDKTFVSTSGNLMIIDPLKVADCYNIAATSLWQKRSYSESNNLWGNWQNIEGEERDTLISDNVTQSTQYRRQVFLDDYPIYITSDTVTLEKIDCDSNAHVEDGIFIETESAFIHGDWEVENDLYDYCNSYVVNNMTNHFSLTDSSTALKYSFTLEEAGIYKVWGRTIAQHGGDNSFHIRINDADWIYWNINSYSTDWLWNEVYDNDLQGVPTFNLSAGVHEVSLVYRENGTKLDKLYIANENSTAPIDPKVIVNNVSGVYLEAECTTLSGDWELEDDINASDGLYLVNNITNQNPLTDAATALTYDVTIEEEGYYNIWARILAANGSDNSLWVKVDDGDWIYWSIYAYSIDWRWSILFDDSAQNIHTFYLSSGPHQISVHYRENGTKLDKLYIGGINACEPNDTDEFCSSIHGNIQLNSASENGLVVNWPSVAHTTGYELDYRSSGTNAWTTVTLDNSVAIMNGLDSCTEYELRVRSLCAVGQPSAYTAISRFSTTDCFICTAPYGLYQFNEQNNSAIITWDVLVGTNSYTYKFRKVGEPNWISQLTTFPIAVLIGIDSCSDYEWTLEVTCEDGTAAESSTINTLSTLCKEDDDVSATIPDIKVIPNPASEFITLSGISEAHLIIYSSLGLEMLNTIYHNGDLININSWKDGVYLIRVKDKNSLWQTLEMVKM